MSPEELLNEWESGEEVGMRPQRVQEVREDLEEHTGLPIPSRLTRIQLFVEIARETGMVERRLKEGPDSP